VDKELYYKSEYGQLYHGDCLEFLKTLGDKSIDAVITDPPYMLGAASARKSANKAIGWADVNNASYWYAQWFAEVWRTMKETAPFWVFGNWRSFPVYQCAASKVPGMSVISVLVWDRLWPGVGSMRGLRQHYEIVALFGKPKFSIVDRKTSDIWPCKWASKRPSGHPQEKPVDLISRMIERSGIEDGAVILDPFFGSGSTGIAAIKSGCRFIAVELDDDHYQKASKRIESETAQMELF
jgi:DNA modification methylase